MLVDIVPDIRDLRFTFSSIFLVCSRYEGVCSTCVAPCVADVPQEKWGFIVVPQFVACVAGVFKLKFFLENKTVFKTSANMNSEKVIHMLHMLHIELTYWYITLLCVADTRFLPATHFSFLLHIAVRAREARAADRSVFCMIRSVFCMIRSVFFMGFLRPLFTIHEELGEAGASAEYYDEREY